ncbi:MAG TPA: hypothetical protein VHJ19_12770 [Gammaproteobacteria bacterium]|nr:hypothetical protein [Gammaproteobacteria bacterium]
MLGGKLLTLGIYLGNLLIAWALGAAVYPASRREIGWAPLRLTEAGQYSCLRHLAPDNTQILHWRGDTFGLPQDATLLASTDVCANQAFSWRYAALALQLHPEVAGSGLERWFIAHAVKIRAILDISVEILHASTARHGPALRRQSPLVLCEWLQDISNPAHMGYRLWRT